jgi:hypothetical protein
MGAGGTMSDKPKPEPYVYPILLAQLETDIFETGRGFAMPKGTVRPVISEWDEKLEISLFDNNLLNTIVVNRSDWSTFRANPCEYGYQDMKFYAARMKFPNMTSARWYIGKLFNIFGWEEGKVLPKITNGMDRTPFLFRDSEESCLFTLDFQTDLVEIKARTPLEIEGISNEILYVKLEPEEKRNGNSE